MNTVILTDFQKPNTQIACSDAFVPIGYGLEVSLPDNAQSGDTWELEIVPLTVKNHLASTVLGHEVFVSNDQELLSIIRGNLFQCGNSDYGTYDFRNLSNANLNHRSDKITTFFNHVFLAIDRTLWWTDLDNYWNWYPAVDSEADFRTIEWEKDNITCLTVLNDILYIHFPESIYECSYVGKPSIVRILKRVTGSGSINARCCVATKNALFFLGLENFYIWSPDVGLKEIGQEVWNAFTSTHSNIQETWAYHDIRNHEIGWVNDNLIWVFNYQEGHWTKHSSNHIKDHAAALTHVNFHPISCEDTSSNIEPDKWNNVENLWVGCWGVGREWKQGDGLANMLSLEVPYLASDDLTFGDIHSFKTSDLVVLDAELGEPWVGIKVLTAGKTRIAAKTVWEVKGTWTEESAHVDFSAVSGKVLRVKFELADGMPKANGAFVVNGGQNLTGKKLDLLNGSVILDGSKTPHNASYYEESSEPRWVCDFYAWGARVNLPERLVGPDK